MPHRNARKCASARTLEVLDERLQRKRWASDAGVQAWSLMREACGGVDGSAAEPAGATAGRGSRGEDRWSSRDGRHLRDELRHLIWNGVPPEMREEVYMTLSGEDGSGIISRTL